MASSDRPPGAQNARSVEAHWSWELFFLIISVIAQVLDWKDVYTFYDKGHDVFFWLSLVFMILPPLYALYTHLNATIELGRVIYTYIRNMNDEGTKLKHYITKMKVSEDLIDSVPKLLIQMTALRMGILEGDLFNYLKLGVSCYTASLAFLSVVRAEKRKDQISVILVAAAIGLRAFVCTSLILASPSVGVIGLVLMFFPSSGYAYHISWKEIGLWKACLLNFCLPHKNQVAIAGFLVYCALAFVILYISSALSWGHLPYVGVVIIEILGTSRWLKFDK